MNLRNIASPLFRGWWVACGAALGLTVGYSAIVTSVIGQLTGPIARDLALSRSDVASAVAFAIYPVIGLAPLAGWLVHRFGALRVIAISQILLALALATLSFARSQLELSLCFAAVAMAGAGTLPIAYTQIILTWFDRRRGLALGISLTGVGLAAIVIAPFSELVVRAQGWRVGTVIIAVTMGFIGLTNALILLRQRPRSVDQIDGGLPLPDVPARFARTDTAGLQALRSSSFYVLVFAFLLLGIPTIGTIVNLPLVLSELGHASEASARLVAAFGAGMIVARLVSGWCLDRFPPVMIVAAIFLAPVIGLVGLASGLDQWVSLWVICLAIGFGGEFDVMAYLLSHRFGKAAYPRLYGLTYAAYNAGAGVGPILLAGAFDQAGSYAPGLWLFALLVAVAGAALVFVAKSLEGRSQQPHAALASSYAVSPCAARETDT